ncbi:MULTISPECIES: cyclic nucleotide-binding domain-containing protein [unclassified Rhizobium]|uniref:cyclic nucleotide-binding domain-containing protein n=1 Tax=unclassified Rhizobium TaxID=2613769 RepID=UPI00160A2003|nr:MULTISPECIES: cyclic nucleotide-binding domain-containing protein [unclassified Rhizobium]MBB3289094.1 CRP/FNR family transcriptional activator FtrB [Rhizobium sp. BK252]MBB3403836.1 CRP/FNR family transcriptional activator FtrB [Rhizobium sp. BK289]MBB3416495.1 CRP/FNR family transcriptional activator FtrB [Rhizobium sp. BK284]MBB3484299.1 CRP/FNR family transcriptional activator FtrB [Rhizobium sp. BK347]
MRSENAAAIRSLELFRDVQDDSFHSLIEASYLQRFPRGVTLIRESEPADFLYIVVEGLVEMFAATETRETTLDIVAPVGVFILAAVLNDEVYLQSARTLEPSSILMIPAGRIRLAMETDPAFMRAIVMELARGYRRTIKDLKSQKLRTSAERLANWLLRADKDQGRHGTVEILVEKRILASRLGMTPENLSRAFSTLKSCGVRVEGSRVEISEPAALVGFAKPDTLIDGPENPAQSALD